MNPFTALLAVWLWIVRGVLSLWVKVAIKPDDIARQLAARPRPVCYVLERDSPIDLAVLNQACGKLHLPRPARRLLLGKARADRAYFELERRAGWISNRIDTRPPRYLRHLVEACENDTLLDFDLVPVSIFWGRTPQKEASWWRLALSEDWAWSGAFRKFLTVLFNGRNTLIDFGEPVHIQEVLRDSASGGRALRRVMRLLRASLRAQRASAIGPDLSHRRTIVAQVLKTSGVRNAVRQEMKLRNMARRAALLSAKKYADEIAANYSQAFVRFMSIALARLWNRLYDGVEFEHVEQLQKAGEGAELIYVPCHRSHMDYLLLSYVIYRKGFAIPHVAAGVNLNMPIVGRFLRKGGAFFLRRTFKGNALYAAVFTRYLGIMMARGHSLEYFIEGGRSRTGRLLEPRTGMLSMTVQSYLRHPKRPVVFIPVYFGYERIVEGKTYLGELLGRPKQKESVFGLLRTLPALRSKFGKVHVNFGEPIALDETLSRFKVAAPDNGTDEERARPAWLAPLVGTLARRIMVEINAAAAVTPVNLVAMAMLATPRQAMPEIDLARQLELYRRLSEIAPYSRLVTVTRMSGAEMIDYALAMKTIERQSHPLGDIIRMTGETAVLATYYRNNILHLYAMPSLLACCFLNNASMHVEDICRLARRIYPYIADELFLRWPESEVDALMDDMAGTFAATGLLVPGEAPRSWNRPATTSIEAVQLSALAQATIQVIERYYVAISSLLHAGSGNITQDALEQRCHLMAQRISMMYGMDSPEFFDKSLFRNFLDLLRERDVIQVRDDGNLEFGEPLLAVAADAQWVLSEQIRHSILQVTHS